MWLVIPMNRVTFCSFIFRITSSTFPGFSMFGEIFLAKQVVDVQKIDLVRIQALEASFDATFRFVAGSDATLVARKTCLRRSGISLPAQVSLWPLP